MPFGLFGTVWSLPEAGGSRSDAAAPIDWAGNVTFAVGLVAVMIGVTYGIRPYGGDPMGWTSPFVIAALTTGSCCWSRFAADRDAREDPMFRLALFRIRAFTFGVLATFLSAVARGGLMFMLIIWLQGIWLPLHGYTFTRRRSGPASACCR